MLRVDKLQNYFNFENLYGEKEKEKQKYKENNSRYVDKKSF